MVMVSQAAVMAMAMVETGHVTLTVPTLAIAVQMIMLVKMLPVMTAGACIATTSLATTMLRDALKSKYLARKDAAECAPSIMKSHAAVMYHSIILKLSAAKSQNTMTLMNAKPANAGFANVSANMFLSTTGSMFVANKAATYLVPANPLKGCTVQISSLV